MAAFVPHLAVERPRRHWLLVPPAAPVSFRESASAAVRSPASPGSSPRGRRRPGPAGCHFHPERVPSPRFPCARTSPLSPSRRPPSPGLSQHFPQSRRRQSSPSGERREGTPAATGPPKMAAAERRGERGGASGCSARRRPSSRRPASRLHTPSPAPSRSSWSFSRTPLSAPPAQPTSDTPWGASNADSAVRGQGRQAQPRGATATTVSLLTVSDGDNRSGSCAAQTLARGEGRERARRRGRGEAPRPGALLSRDLNGRVGGAGRERDAAHLAQ